MFEIRTDLAVEENERIQGKSDRIHGVTVEEERLEGEDIRITTVKIETENGAKANLFISSYGRRFAYSATQNLVVLRENIAR